MEKQYLPEAEDSQNGVSRRKFLIGTGAVAGAAALFGASSLTPGQRAGVRVASAAQLNTDLDVLQFALTLEHLEAEAYRVANASGLLSGRVLDIFKEFGAHEAAHVVAITDTIRKLGAEPVKKQEKYNFPMFGSQDDVVRFFAQVEEVGAGAYLGAAPLIKNNDILNAAAAIHNVEGQHASVLRTVLNDPMPSPAFAKPLMLEEVLAAVNPLLKAEAAAPAGKFYTNLDPAASITAAMGAVSPVANRADLTFFAETKHTSSGPFLDYWKKMGGLMQFGYPITEPFNGTNPTDGKTYVQQYYQRARLEWHPENKGTQYEVQLGLLGAEQLLKGMMGR